ncbi:hypothetical protein HY620_00560, partial [Candidatus Uhrbacteria bacterium]|nr:hypothetical protein [Candidatus Uhrbacteria bacterium]
MHKQAERSKIRICTYAIAVAIFVATFFLTFSPSLAAGEAQSGKGMYCIGGWCVDGWGTVEKSDIKGGRICINGEGNCVGRNQLMCASKGGDTDNDEVCNADDECENHACARDGSNSCLYNGCPEEKPTIYNETYDVNDRRIEFDVRGDEANISITGGGYHEYSKKGVGDYKGYTYYPSSCNYYQINAYGLNRNRKNPDDVKTLIVGDSLEEVNIVCPRPEIYGETFDTSDRYIKFNVRGDEADIVIKEGGSIVGTWSRKENGNYTGYTYGPFSESQCKSYVIEVTPVNQSRHSGTVTKSIEVSCSSSSTSQPPITPIPPVELPPPSSISDTACLSNPTCIPDLVLPTGCLTSNCIPDNLQDTSSFNLQDTSPLQDT